MRKNALCLFVALISVAPVLAQQLQNTVSINTPLDPRFSLSAKGETRFDGIATFGEEYDNKLYAKGLQILRLADQGDNLFHLSFIRHGQKIAGLGFLRNSNVLGIQNQTSNASPNGIFLTGDGKTGINVSDPTQELDVNGVINIRSRYLFLDNGNGTFYSDANNMAMFCNGGYVFANKDNSKTRAYISADGGLYMYDAANTLRALIYASGDSYINTTGGLAIGSTSTGGYKLGVNGSIGATRLKVIQSWADFVFDKNYHLPSLQEVAVHIEKHHHLPGIPSASEIEKNRLDVGEMQQLQMQKIEELTLYIIALNKKLEAQQKELDELKKKK